MLGLFLPTTLLPWLSPGQFFIDARPIDPFNYKNFNNNTCLEKQALLPPTYGAPQTFLAECPDWVIRTTDEIWNQGDKGFDVLKKYFHPNFTSHYSFGRSYTGLEGLRNAVSNTKKAFPDLKIHITDCYCIGNDIDGYKTVMPDVLHGTNTGFSEYGRPTNRTVTYAGIALTYVQRNADGQWQYVAEWVLHDELSLVNQLGVDLNQVPFPNTHVTPNKNCDINRPTWGAYEPTPGPVPQDPMPLAKRLVKKMDALISGHINVWNYDPWAKAMAPFWTPDMIYDTNWTPFKGVLGNSTGLEEWFYHEHIPYNIGFRNCSFTQMIFAAEEYTATTTSYGKAIFQADFAGIPHTSGPVTIRIFDFYRIDPKTRKIEYNWMLLDLPFLMLQTGNRVLPKPALREGWFQPPRALDGLPAPISGLVDPKDTTAAKDAVFKIMQSDWQGDLIDTQCGGWMQDMVWYGPVGIGMARGCEEYVTHFLAPLHSAFSGAKFALDVFTCEGSYCGVLGRFIGRHSGTWLGQPATGKMVGVRAGMHFRVDMETKLVAESWAILDLPDAFNQMGVNLWDRMNINKNSA